MMNIRNLMREQEDFTVLTRTDMNAVANLYLVHAFRASGLQLYGGMRREADAIVIIRSGGWGGVR